MFYVPYDRQSKFRQNMSKTGIKEISWDIDQYGAKRVI